MYEFKKFVSVAHRQVSHETRKLLSEGGVRQARACQCYQDTSAEFKRNRILSCRCTALKIIGAFAQAGATYDEARFACLNGKARGMDALTRTDVDPRVEFDLMWSEVAQEALQGPNTERTEDDRRTMFIGLVGASPGLKSTDIRRALPLRHTAIAELREWALSAGLVELRTVGRKVLHYRTNKVYEPLDRYETLEDFRLFAPLIVDEDIAAWLDSGTEESETVLRRFMEKRRAYVIANGEGMTARQFVNDCYGLTTQQQWDKLTQMCR